MRMAYIKTRFHILLSLSVLAVLILFAAPTRADVLRDIRYGAQTRQQLDVHRPNQPQKAPVVIMVHGGGWAFGDKGNGRTVTNKSQHYLRQGKIFISLNYRLVPQVTPVQQAADVARAIAFVQQNAAQWGGDPQKIIVMGHSAGAHLVSLVHTSDKLRAKFNVQPWLGTVSLDTLAYDVSKIMNNNPEQFYKYAFGPRPSAQVFTRKAAHLGTAASVLPIALGHMQINANLGRAGSYTDAVDAWMAKVTR